LIKIAPDKQKHFFVGILLGAVLQIITGHLIPQHYVLSITITFILLIAICYGFELFSLITKKGHYEILDAVAGIIGGVIGMIIILLLKISS
jgi:VanZ family protein